MPTDYFDATWKQRLIEHLNVLYPHSVAMQVCGKILAILEQQDLPQASRESLWDQKDVILITYGDTLSQPQKKPLETLKWFSQQYLKDTISAIHILPFYPFSSDDGFSVIDFTEVNNTLGDWDDIESISADFDLMADLVLNHISSRSIWFADFVSGNAPGNQYFINLPPETDVSQVTRPRNTPLLVPYYTRRGVKHVWATFSEDQIDLNYENPQVLLEMIQILLLYVRKGSRFIRLDAVAFLWKTLGTSCIHLPQTHEVVKLFRTILAQVAPHVVIITETNVPHKENVSYFGQGDEAHMVYQFALPPLMLYTLNRGNALPLATWAKSLDQLPENCTYLNFTASHDGIGVRALEGLIPPHETKDLVECMHRFGGFVTMRTGADGEDTPYEINISYFDAMMGTRMGPDHLHIERFLCSQTIMMAMQGIPAIYIHSLFGTPNDLKGVEHTGRLRSINRRKWNWEELAVQLEEPSSQHQQVFISLRRRLNIRNQQLAFAPQAMQTVLDTDSAIFGFVRHSSRHSIAVLNNIRSTPQTINLVETMSNPVDTPLLDLLDGELFDANQITLDPYQSVWLELHRE